MTSSRTDNFVPLTSAAPAAENGEFRIKIISGAQSAQTFQALEPAAPRQAGTPLTLADSKCEPQLVLQRDGARITNIRVQCSCGQVMDLACVYDEPAAAS